MVNIYQEIVKMQKNHRAGVLITVIDRKGQGPAVVGKKMLIVDNGEKYGTVGGGELEYLAFSKAKELLTQQCHYLQGYDFNDGAEEGTFEKINMICGGYVTLFFEYLPVTPVLYIMGGGHVGRCLLDSLKNLDYTVVLMENRKDIITDNICAERIVVGDYHEMITNEPGPDGCYVVIAGYSHEIDFEILKAIYRAQWRPKYIGLLASPKKGKTIIQHLQQELGGSVDISMLHSPVGLDIGGESPEEIAISIVSEIQAVRYGKGGHRHLGQKWSIS